MVKNNYNILFYVLQQFLYKIRIAADFYEYKA